MFSKFQSLPSYFGGKRKLVKYIFKPIKKKDGVFIDAFLGGGLCGLSQALSFAGCLVARLKCSRRSCRRYVCVRENKNPPG